MIRMYRPSTGHQPLDDNLARGQVAPTKTTRPLCQYNNGHPITRPCVYVNNSQRQSQPGPTPNPVALRQLNPTGTWTYCRTAGGRPPGIKTIGLPNIGPPLHTSSPISSHKVARQQLSDCTFNISAITTSRDDPAARPLQACQQAGPHPQSTCMKCPNKVNFDLITVFGSYDDITSAPLRDAIHVISPPDEDDGDITSFTSYMIQLAIKG